MHSAMFLVSIYTLETFSSLDNEKENIRKIVTTCGKKRTEVVYSWKGPESSRFCVRESLFFTHYRSEKGSREAISIRL